MREKRIKLFNDLVDLAAKKGEVEQFEQKYKDYNGWESFNFKNEQTVTDLYNKTIALGIFSNTSKIEDFFKKFACDILKTSTYCSGTASTTTSDTNVFSCLLKDTDLKFNTSNNTVYYKGTRSEDGSVFHWTFYSNNRFYSDGSNKKGSWSCDGTDAYIIKLDDGSQTFSSKTNQWTDGVTSSPSSNTTTITDTNLTGDDLAAGKAVKLGMRGDIVGKIQDLLIAKGFTNVSKSKTADKIFGNRTQRMVKAFQALNGLNDDGVVGKLTWGKLNDAAAITAGSTPDSSTNKATSVNSPEEVPGSDAIIVQESRKKILRKYLLQFK